MNNHKDTTDTTDWQENQPITQSISFVSVEKLTPILNTVRGSPSKGRA